MKIENVFVECAGGNKDSRKLELCTIMTHLFPLSVTRSLSIVCFGIVLPTFIVVICCLIHNNVCLCFEQWVTFHKLCKLTWFNLYSSVKVLGPFYMVFLGRS